MEEKELISLCQRGDLKSFEMLVGFYQHSVLAVATRILSDRDEACDAAQDAFVQAFFNLNSYDPQRSFRAWLLGITVKRCLDRLRRRKSYLNFIQQYAGFIKLNVRSENNEMREAFGTLLRNLNERERVALTLQVEEGLSASEIAEIMGCSPSTIRVHLFNARRKLQKEMKHHV